MKIQLKSNIGKIIDKKGYKKKWVADQLGVSQTVFSRWVTGQNIPSVINCFRLAAILECKVDDLYSVEYLE